MTVPSKRVTAQSKFRVDGFGRLPFKISVGVGGQPGAIKRGPSEIYPQPFAVVGLRLSSRTFIRVDSDVGSVPRIATASGNGPSGWPQVITSAFSAVS